MSLLAWTRIADRIGPMSVVRLGLGPLVLLVAAIGAGPADVTTLARPAAAPLIVLAMAFAAMTPGFPIAAAALAGTSIALFVAHWQIISAHPLANLATDDYAIGIIVTLLASTGMAIVVRVATEAEARATRLSASNRQRVDVLERSTGSSPASMDRSRSRTSSRPSSTTSRVNSRSPWSRCTCRSAATS